MFSLMYVCICSEGKYANMCSHVEAQRLTMTASLIDLPPTNGDRVSQLNLECVYLISLASQLALEIL